MNDQEYQEAKQAEQIPRLGPSLVFIYFMMGLVIGAVLTMVGLSFIRPFLPLDSTWVKALVLSPLILGAGLGYRVARLGAKGPLLLSEAILSALWLRRPSL